MKNKKGTHLRRQVNTTEFDPVHRRIAARRSPPYYPVKLPNSAEEAMAWTTPTLVEICIGLEINGYLPAEF